MTEQSKKVTNTVAITTFVIACSFLAFLAGVAVSVFKVGPFAELEQAFTALSDYTEGDIDEYMANHHLFTVRYPETGAKTFDPAAVQPGVTLITSHWKDGDHTYPGARLIDQEGTVLHEWRVYPEKIWPDSPHSDFAAGSKNRKESYIHGIWLLESGDIVFNIEYLGLIRMDACGEVVWKLPYRTHHSVFRTSDGDFWVSGLRWATEKSDEYWHMRPPFVDETLVKVSADGEIQREIHILRSMYESGFEGMLANSRKVRDFTHMNDVEELSAEYAPAFEDFNAGDLLVSLRNLNTIMVLDPETGKIKWHLMHPLIRQHDPDFTADGTIIVFNNRDDGTQTGERLGQSRIIEVDPSTNAVKTIWPLDPEQEFYTATGGKQQLLENGNLLITEVLAGRLLEISPEGKIVWSWVVDDWGNNLAPEVLEGSRYPSSFADFADTSCPAGT